MSRPIPARPNLEKDRKAAKALKQAHAARAPEALARIREHHPRWRGRSDAELAAAPFTLADAQLVVAREYGLESWPRWKALASFLRADFAARVRLFLEAALGDDPRRSHELLSRARARGGGSAHGVRGRRRSDGRCDPRARSAGRHPPRRPARRPAVLGAPTAEGRTAYAIARRLGNLATAQHLLACGASDAIPEADAFAAPCDSGDERAARALLARDPGLLTGLSPQDLALLPEAARLDHRDAVRVMLEVGFPVDALEGFDMSGSALNHAAFHAHVELVDELLARGADPELTNQFGGTALGSLAWSSGHASGADVHARSEEQRQRDLVRSAERLLAAGARILPQHLANASPPLAELLRRHGAADAED